MMQKKTYPICRYYYGSISYVEVVNTGEVSTGYILCALAGGSKGCVTSGEYLWIFSANIGEVSGYYIATFPLNFTQLVLGQPFNFC
ncbi:hypothetical protein GU50_12000 [Salmonella enterica subsp. enterica serovar Bareilly str. CFSAN000233]|nr:hypothetical protein GU50_12000 [Salmonella enterica subsp. enterica serovar Bareilly str. CFSAN000233]KFS91940.1 hypothetical protein GU41_00540 [Salmonella enterica subsp. enterica serovar Bareilly str. CFSAN000232]